MIPALNKHILNIALIALFINTSDITNFTLYINTSDITNDTFYGRE